MIESMRTRLPAVLAAGVVALSCFFTSSPVRADFPDVVASVKRSVVAIGTLSPTRNPRFRFLGTGFVVGDGNQVVTSAHVIGMRDLADDEKFVMVQPGTTKLFARPIEKETVDADHDLAVLRFDGPSLPAVRVGDASAVRDGQDIAVTGFPLGGAIGITPVTHKGIISAITPVGQPAANARDLNSSAIRRLALGGYTVLQLDITSYPGNSGSPLFDVHTGEVLGVLSMVFIKGAKETALTSPSGITYAIPSTFLVPLLTKP